ncbi:hypothetical protein [Acetobacter thailandicus]|uniref:Transposase n=1 Tax=Acetobacter thailandicus TaxID=1502842 RepID=A0ABT3QB63_9PROT|nr:hypothetical protein [Acetobacter thailandicus]MCX2562518.1 hypothetical protein [Acetobacter thailandicus]NHN94586.1 hypothetical protein [Acetobacter thailandicus]
MKGRPVSELFLLSERQMTDPAFSRWRVGLRMWMAGVSLPDPFEELPEIKAALRLASV